jgi:hypothetical protein
MWMQLETIHITMSPTYTSMYFPAQGLVLAAGKVLCGHPWYGLLIVSSLMCASICWMLQAWLPPTWAFLGGMIAVLHIGLFSYWINTYHSAGLIAALGGAVVLGAFPRLIKTSQMRYGMLLATGIALLILTRPYEGLLLCLPVTCVLIHWIFFGKDRPNLAVLLRRSLAPILLIIATFSWLGYYDSKAFGRATTLPYTVDRAAYATAPYFVWQEKRPDPHYNHPVMHSFYNIAELSFYSAIHSGSKFLPLTILKAFWALQFFAGIALIPPLLLMMYRVVRDRRMRFFIASLPLLAAGMIIQVFFLPHYLAPFTAAFYVIGLQAMRHLWVWKLGSKPIGMTMTRISVAICVLVATVRLDAGPLHIPLREWPSSDWNFTWYGPDHFGKERAQIAEGLEQLPGKQLALVRYDATHNPFNEWVYNSADIDSSKVIWAREMDAVHNAEILNYYKDRRVWLVQPDSSPAEVTSYVPSHHEFAAVQQDQKSSTKTETNQERKP